MSVSQSEALIECQPEALTKTIIQQNTIRILIQAAVLGRKVFYVRICSCHKRDKVSEEERMQNLKLKANHTTLPRTHLQHLGTTPSLHSPRCLP